MGLAMTGWQSNLIVYLIDQFNIKQIDAAQIYNVVNGCMCLLPLVAAIVADSYFGCFPVASISSFISFLVITVIRGLGLSGIVSQSRVCRVWLLLAGNRYYILDRDPEFP